VFPQVVIIFRFILNFNGETMKARQPGR